MAKRKQKLTPNQQAYNAQVKRIKRAYRELEKQGYRIDKPVSDFIPESRPQRVTQSALKKLKSITRAALRKVSTALNEAGKPVSGTEVFKERRSRSAQKAAETRKYFKWLESPAGQAYQRSQMEAQWAENRRKLDAVQWAHAKWLEEGEIILNNVQSLIDKYQTAGSTYLKRALDHEISTYGRNAVMRSMGEAPADFVEQAQNIIFYQEKMSGEEASRSIRDFIDLIRGALPTEEEARELGELQSQLDAYENPD